MAQSSSRPFCFIDAYADGVMILHAGEKISEAEKEFHIAFALPGGKRRVTLYFPNLVSIAFGDVTLECATFFEPYYPRRRFLMLGDSITQGYDAIYPSLSYANRIGAHFDAEILNQSIGGECFNAGLIDPKLPFRPDLITVAYGTNDWTNLSSRDVLAHGADAFFSRLTDVYPDTKIAYISPLWRARLEGEPYRDRPTPTFCEGVALLESVAAKYGSIHIIHGGALTPHVCDFYSDGYLHPNDLGFSVYAENLERELEKLI
jgi:lysophospholipase L1-like esterase